MKLSDPRFLVSATENYFGRRKKSLDAAARIDLAIKEAFEEFSLDEARRTAFGWLLNCVWKRTQMLRQTPGQGSGEWTAPVFFVNRLRNVAARHAFWLRRCETWQPAGATARLQFRSLLHHLFCMYPVPAFMESVWDCPSGPEAFRQQGWYMRLGRGGSLRALNLPIELTRRMTHLATL